ncbi:MAG: hypothetical protein ABI045_03480 [Flavobacteriales bacterium]
MLGFIFNSQEDVYQRAIDASWINTSDVALIFYNRSRDEKWGI